MVGLSMLTFAPGRMGGSETYVRGLTAALASHGSNEYVVATPPDARDAGGGLPVVGAGARSTRSRPVAFACAAVAGRALRGADVVHYPLTVPLPAASTPYAVTLHDLLHLRPEGLVSPLTRVFRRVAYDRAARRADRVIVPSAFVRDEAVAKLGLDPARIRVVPHAVDASVFRPGPAEREPFVLYPARAWPHKNHRLLFQAFALARRVRPRLELLLTGGGHERLPLPDGVRSLGLVDVAELAELYRRASAVAFPSSYEGFGLPVLEALASGCPVVAASGTAVAEIAGDSIMIAPPIPDAFAAAMIEAIDTDPVRLERGVAHARTFSWERVARGHDAVYDELRSQASEGEAAR